MALSLELEQRIVVVESKVLTIVDKKLVGMVLRACTWHLTIVQRDPLIHG